MLGTMLKNGVALPQGLLVTADTLSNSVVASVPIGVAPAKNCTWLTVPSVSLALADTVIAAPAANDAPLAGAVRLTVGGLFTVMVTDADVVVAPRLSVATAVST